MNDEHQQAEHAGRQPDQINVSAIVKTTVGLCVLLACTLLFTYLSLPALNLSGEAPPVRQRPGEKAVATPGPLLIPDQELQLAELRRQELEILDHYGWVDREQGIARIPIDRAIELMGERLAGQAARSQEGNDGQ